MASMGRFRSSLNGNIFGGSEREEIECRTEGVGCRKTAK